MDEIKKEKYQAPEIKELDIEESFSFAVPPPVSPSAP